MSAKTLTSDDLRTWTTASLVLQLASYAPLRNTKRETDQDRVNALAVAVELNERVPPRTKKDAVIP